MKKIINGKKYDTDTAKKLASGGYGWYSDLDYIEETLYKKRTGEFFLFGKGGPASKYSEYNGNGHIASWDIIPLTESEAKQWTEKNCNSDEYEEIFGEVAE